MEDLIVKCGRRDGVPACPFDSSFRRSFRVRLRHPRPPDSMVKRFCYRRTGRKSEAQRQWCCLFSSSADAAGRARPYDAHRTHATGALCPCKAAALGDGVGDGESPARQAGLGSPVSPLSPCCQCLLTFCIRPTAGPAYLPWGVSIPFSLSSSTCPPSPYLDSQTLPATTMYVPPHRRRPLCEMDVPA